MLIPTKIDTVLYPSTPYMNIGIIGLCILMLPITIVNGVPEAFILDGWNPVGIIGSLFMHGGWLHLGFNMLFLWVFGNAVCSNFGNGKYLLLFLFCGLISAIAFNLFNGGRAIGASGAINGIIGFYLVLYPTNKVQLRYLLLYPPINYQIRIAGFWVIVFWFIGDLIGSFSSGSNIAYWGHIGGFVGGFWAGFLSLKKDWMIMNEYDKETLPSLISSQKP